MVNLSINIPKIIWQTGKEDFDNLPYPLNLNVQTWKKLNPNWEYKYSNDIQAGLEVKKFDPILYELYENLKGCYRADLWRYIMVYQYGGVYADTDSVAIIPLDIITLLDYEKEIQFLKPEKNRGIYVNKLIPLTSCQACDSFCKIFKTGKYGKDFWMANALFAASPKSIPLKSLLSDIYNKFEVYKKLHNNILLPECDAILTIVDCSAYDVAINKEEKNTSFTFFYGKHAPNIFDNETNSLKKMFKDIFKDYKMFNGKVIKYSELK